MRRFFRAAASICAALAAAVIVSINACAATIFFEDGADLYTDAEEKQLIKEQQELCDYTGWNIAVITTDIDFPEDGYQAVEYAESRYKEIYGSCSADGILYLVDTGYRHFAIGGEPDTEYFNDSRVRKMIDRCNEKYYGWDDMGNARTYFACVREFYDKGPFKNDMIAEALPVGAVSGLVAAIIGVVCVLSRYKWKHRKSPASYIKPGGVNMYESHDIFLRENVTRTRIESSSGGGGGGHGSSGGHSMGGGGSGGHR